jgi:glycerol-3-phosphate dehydrogenase
VNGVDAEIVRLRRTWPFLTGEHAQRLTRAYGTRADRFLKEAQSLDDLGPRFAGDLTGAEVRYLVEEEWAETADDVLWRRSKLGLRASPEERAKLAQFIASLAGKPA